MRRANLPGLDGGGNGTGLPAPSGGGSGNDRLVRLRPGAGVGRIVSSAGSVGADSGCGGLSLEGS